MTETVFFDKFGVDVKNCDFGVILQIKSFFFYLRNNDNIFQRIEPGVICTEMNESFLFFNTRTKCVFFFLCLYSH